MQGKMPDVQRKKFLPCKKICLRAAETSAARRNKTFYSSFSQSRSALATTLSMS